jgi:PST family polysaccharide transporter
VTFVINAVMGIAWCAVTLALAPFVAAFFGNPEAASIIRVLAFGFVLKFLGNTHDALAQKDLRFRARAVPEVGQAVTKAAVSIALAIAGFGAWSLVWGHLGGLAIWTVGSWAIVPWRPRVMLPRDLFAPMLRYGRGIVGVNVLAAIVHHADLAIVGRMLGATALGLYQIAYKIPEATITVVMWVVSKVLFPAFSKLHGEDELRGAYLKALTYVSLVTIPMAAGLCVAAEPIVRVFFGATWIGAVPLLQWLAVYAGLRSIGTHAGDILKATGRTGLLAGLGVVKAALLLPALILAARTSVDAVAMALVAVTAVTVAINIGMVMHFLRFGVASLLGAIRPSAMAGAVLVIAAIALQRIAAQLRPELLLAVTVFAGGIVYTAAVFVFDRRLLEDVWRRAR